MDTNTPSPAQLLELAARHGLELAADGLRIEEAGLDFRVAFARAAHDDTRWVLRIPRRPEVASKLDTERCTLDFLAPRLSVAVPRWQVCSPQLIAYRRLPGEPGLTLDDEGQPVWHYDPQSVAFATALGELIAALHALDPDEAARAGVPVAPQAQARDRLRAELEVVCAAFEVAPALEASWRAWIDDDVLWPEPIALTHGELYAAHVLIDGAQRILGVLDWTTAVVGDPAVDFTYQHMMGPAAFDATVAAYRRAGGADHAALAERCAALTAAAPLRYATFALASGDPKHREAATAMLAAREG